jgi:hypothetical protein
MPTALVGIFFDGMNGGQWRTPVDGHESLTCL